MIGLGGCGSGSSSTGSAAPATPSTTAERASGPAVETASGSSIAGFGTAARGREKAAVATAVHSFLTALADRDYPELCGGVTATNRAQLQAFGKGQGGSEGCAAVLRKLINPAVAGEARKAAAAPIKSVRIKGETAFALFTPRGRSTSYLVMQEEGGGWKATSLTPGTPLDPTVNP